MIVTRAKIIPFRYFIFDFFALFVNYCLKIAVIHNRVSHIKEFLFTHFDFKQGKAGYL